MRVALLFFLAVCVASALGSRTAVDLWFNDAQASSGYPAGYMTLPVPLSLGVTGAVGLEVNCFLHQAVNNERNSIMFFGPRNSVAGDAVRSVADDIEVFLINQGTSSQKVGVRVGSESFTTSATFNVVKTWAYIAVNVFNQGSAAQVEIYVNGAKQTLTNNGVTSTFVLRAVARDYNFMGYSPITAQFRGLVDTLQIWDQKLTAATVSKNALYTDGDFPWTPQGLIVRFDFTEGTGTSTRGRVGTAGTTTYVSTLAYPRAVFSGGDVTGWVYCMGWGDPHYQTYYTTYNYGALSAFDANHVTGYYNLLGCKNSAGDYDFHVSSWHVPQSGGVYTINRAMSIRMGQSMFQFSSSSGIAAGIPGTYLFKEIPLGADPATVGWTSLAAGTSKTLASGMVIALPNSYDGGDINIYAAPYARIVIHNNGWYCDFEMWINAGGCNSQDIGDAICKGYTAPVPSWVFLGTPNPTPPLAAATPVAPPPPGPSCGAGLQAIAETNCKRCFPAYATTQSIQYTQCITDVCFTGNPYCPIPACTPGEPCCQCASTGQCVVNAVDNSTSCACDNGYGGSDCSQSLNLVALTLQTGSAQMFDGLNYPLAPHTLDDIDGRSTAPDTATLISANPWIVKNSLLVYVATMTYPTSEGMIPSQHLYVVSDASSFTGSWTSTLGITYTGFDSYTGVPGVFNTGVALSDATSRPASASFTTRPTASTGFVIPNLPDDWCVTFTPSFEDSVGQVVVGSGNLRGQLELLRVVDAKNNGFTVCGKKQTDPCPNLTDCKSCTANAACGWCRTSSECHYGRPAGPTDGYSCQAWAFTFDAVTRRITQTYGYPVTPVDTTVVLSASDSKNLPIEINVDMAYRYYTAWDIQVLFPNSASNSADLAGLKASIQDVADRLAANYLNSALSVGLYSSRAVAGTADANGDNVVFNQVFPLVATTQSASIYDTIVPVGVTARTGTPQLSLAVPRYVGLANNRANARTLVIIFATQYDTSLSASALKSTFVSSSALPVFIVSAAAKAQYQALVTSIGFGLVQDYASSSQIGLAIDRALTDASGATFLTVDTANSGPINTAALNPVISSLTVTGMSNQMRSRNNFPVSSQVGNSADAVILVPGFGKATIETVESDSPYTTGPAVNMVVGQALDPYTTDVTIPAALSHLTGAPADVLQSTALVSASVKAVSIGQLYQFDETHLRNGGLVSGLVPVDFSQAVNGYVAVTDIQGRLVYHPPDNTFSTGDAVYATITYKVNDECSDSPDGTVDIYVAYANNKPPTTAAKAYNTAENAPVAITLTATDYRAHTLNFVFPAAVSNNGGSAAIAGKIYQYSAACLAAVTADVEAVSTCTEITAGSIIAGTPSAGASSTTISTLQIIYVPYKYANSEGIPAVYLAKPVIQYQAVQIKNDANDGADFVALQTPVLSFGVNISAVNQAPFAYRPTESSTWLSFDAASFLDVTTGCRASNDPAVTTVTCNYEQNLGVDYPGIPSTVPIYAVAFDVDSDTLKVVVQAVTCPADAILTNVIDGSTVTAGMTVNNAQSWDTWATAVSFRPSQDGSGNPYCTLSYYVSDGALSSAIQTININITSVPLPPRSTDQRFFAPRLDQPLAIQVTAGAVDERIVSGTVKHYIKKAVITACSGDLTSSLVIAPNTEAVDCANLGSGYEVVVESNADDSSASLYGSGQMHTFAGNWTPTAASVNGFAVTIHYVDDQGLTSPDYTLSFSYRQVNQAPEFLWIAAGDAATYVSSQSQAVGLRLVSGSASASISFQARDVDSGSGMVILTVDHNADNSVVSFSSAGDEGYIIQTATGITATAPIAAINQIMSSLSVNIKNGGSKQAFTVKVQVDDQGFTGACSQAQVTPCAKYGTATIAVTASAGTPVVAIGLAAGAGGAAVAAAGAAALAWRSLREPPTESYNPWEMDDSNEGTVMNPLFESTGNSGSNPTFEGAAKH